MRKKKSVEVDIETCASCRFFLLDDPKSDAGYCRRSPPVHIGDAEDGGWTFPVAVPAEWCGEYKRITQ
ncbi:MAG TPA: hypothetical protein VIM12_06625 [Noviherbaspirillum sp.]|jgi:hypothetical protein|uniref:hypothetical protein n=1 Tax=Noviherbaspirillum sp. TaxID=1926288 RepID=UPI002F942BE7